MNLSASDMHMYLKEHRSFLFVVICVTVYSVFFSWVGIWWHNLYYTNVDLDIFEQALWNTIHSGDLLYANEYGGSSHFGTHFSPILLCMLPVYALFQHTETILIIQAIILGAGAIPLYFITTTRLSQTAGVCVSGVYLLYPALHGITTCEFHEIVFFPLFFLFAFAFLIRHHYCGYIISALLCISIKEDVALLVIMLGLWGLWQDRCKSRKIQLVHICLIAASIITMAAAILVIIPFFNPDGIYPHFQNAYFSTGVNTEEPIGGRAIFIAQLLAPVLGLPLLAPEILFIGLPGYLELFIPNYPAFWDIGQHYSAIIIPVILIALVFGLVRIERYIGARRKGFFPAILILLLISSGLSTILISPSPLSIGFQHVWAYDQKIQPYKKILDPIIAEIDQNKEISVGSHHPLLTHLSRRRELNTIYTNTSDIILVAEGYPDGKILKNNIEPALFSPVFSRYDITVYINKNGKLADKIQ
jgi:uncharacterized membrane protein